MKTLKSIIREYLADTVAHCTFKQAWIPKGWACVEIETATNDLTERISKEVIKMARGNKGRGGRGACGGTRRRDGSGRGRGNRGTRRQPKR
jgi:hypothetical protein